MKKLCFLTVTSLGCNAKSCFSVSVELLLGFPSSSDGSRNVQKLGVSVLGRCEVCFHWEGSPSLHLRSPYGETEVLQVL